MKAMKNGSGIVKPKIAENIANEIEEEFKDSESVDIYDIEAMVYDKLITKKQRLTAKAYEGYRSIREFQRENNNTTDSDVIELINGDNDYWQTENANKNPVLNTTVRDYMADGKLYPGYYERDFGRSDVVKKIDKKLENILKEMIKQNIFVKKRKK